MAQEKFWIARDKDGELYLMAFDSDKKPECIIWSAVKLRLDKTLYPELKYKDSPQQVELKLKERNG